MSRCGAGARVLPPPPYERLAMLLERYLSKILVRSVLKASCDRIGVGPSDVWPRDMERLVEEVMRGLRVWVSTERLPDLMIELAELCLEIEQERHQPIAVKRPIYR
jgi:hypothetical protein